MIIATWNVNSLKSRLQIVKKWLEDNNPDFLLLQEIKGLDEEIFKEFVSLGYKSYSNLQKTYNGVAILTKYSCEIINTEIPNFPDIQARILTIKHNDYYIINVYMPNGNPLESEKYTYKLNWNSAFYNYIKDLVEENKNFIIAGDFNIAPLDIDVYSTRSMEKDALVQKEVRDFYFKLLNLGLLDALKYKYPNHQNIYTWWDYRHSSFAKDKGLRIDHILLSPFFADKYKNCLVDKVPRIQEKPSDHTPVVCYLED